MGMRLVGKQSRKESNSIRFLQLKRLASFQLVRALSTALTGSGRVALRRRRGNPGPPGRDLGFQRPKASERTLKGAEADFKGD